MHELSIALSILDVVAEEAQNHGNCQVKGIHLKLGPLSGVVEDALKSAFEMAREDSPFMDAELIVNPIPIQIHCPKCRATRSVISLQEMCCSECGTFGGDIISGRELEVVALEIE